MPKKKIPVSDVEKIKKLYEIVRSIGKVANIYEVSHGGMYSYMKRHNIKIRKQGVASSYSHLEKITKEVNVVGETYKDLRSIKKVAEKFNVTELGMYSYMKRNNIKIRKQGKRPSPYTCIDENAFSELNEFSEYWIGFLYADGNTTKLKRKGAGYSKWFSCFLKKEDKNHIIKALDFLKTDYEIRFKKSTGKTVINGKEYKLKGEGCGFQITNDKLVDDLLSYGFTSKKSWEGKITDKRLLKSRHFWRGYIDGDGSIGYYKNGPNFSVLANDLMMKEFHKYIYKNVLHDNIFESETFNRTKTLRLKNFSGWNAYLLMIHFYKNSNISLDRKIKIVNNCINNWKPKRKYIQHTIKSQVCDIIIQGYNYKKCNLELGISYSTFYQIQKILKNHN